MAPLPATRFSPLQAPSDLLMFLWLFLIGATTGVIFGTGFAECWFVAFAALHWRVIRLELNSATLAVGQLVFGCHFAHPYIRQAVLPDFRRSAVLAEIHPL